jgi:branched-subunit amino acid aminotransferase/4-amino-4-deoxychorismate lyase
MDKRIWMNGNFVRQSQAPEIEPDILEEIKVVRTSNGPAIFRIEAHLERFAARAASRGIDLGCGPDALYSIISRTILYNQLAEGCVVLAVYRNTPGTNSLMTVTTSPQTHGNLHPANTIPDELVPPGFQVIDPQVVSTEGCAESLFIVQDRVVFTNPQQDEKTCIAQESMITLARDLGFEVVESLVAPDALIHADEAFFCTATFGIAPVRSHSGPVTQRLQLAMEETLQGKGNRSAEWLDWVWNSYLGL